MQNASATPSTPARSNTIATFPFTWEVLSASALGDRVVAEMKQKDDGRRQARRAAEASREEARKKQLAAYGETPAVVIGQRQQRRYAERQEQKRIEQALRPSHGCLSVSTTGNRHERRRAASLARKATA